MTSKSYAKGGAGAIDIAAGQTVDIHWQKARVWGLYANGAGATVRLPKATEEFSTGARLYFICNLGSSVLNVHDADDNLLGTLANEESFEVALLDNSTTAGEWSVNLKSIGIVEPPANFLLVMGGSGVGSAQLLQRLDENFETWSTGATIPQTGEYSQAWRLGDLAYVHASQNRRDQTDEYIADTWTSRTDSPNDHHEASVSQTNSVAFVAGKFDPATYDAADTWVTKNPYGTGATSANGSFATGFRNHMDSFGGDLSYMHCAGTNGLRGFYEYTLTGDTYTNCANDYPVNAGDIFEMAHWMFEDFFHASAGRVASGSLGSSPIQDHVRADVSMGAAGVTWSTTVPDYPEAVSSAGAQNFKGSGYVFGGNTSGVGATSVDSARKFPEGAATWTSLVNAMTVGTSRINSAVTSTLKI